MRLLTRKDIAEVHCAIGDVAAKRGDFKHALVHYQNAVDIEETQHLESMQSRRDAEIRNTKEANFKPKFKAV